MTVAQVGATARLLEREPPSAVVWFEDVGSEGAVLRLRSGHWQARESRVWLIARDGTSQERTG